MAKRITDSIDAGSAGPRATLAQLLWCHSRRLRGARMARCVFDVESPASKPASGSVCLTISFSWHYNYITSFE